MNEVGLIVGKAVNDEALLIAMGIVKGIIQQLLR